MPSFDAASRKSITRRQLNILTENAAFTATQNALNDVKLKLLDVDNANNIFFLSANNTIIPYENEVRYKNGVVSSTYSIGTISPYVAGTVVDSAKAPGSDPALFFPNGSPTYAESVPKVLPSSNGYANPSGTDARYEQNILTNAIITEGLTESIFRLDNGITGASTATTTSTASMPTGPQTGYVLDVTSSSNFAINEKVYLNNLTASGLYVITAKTLTSLTLDSVIPSTISLPIGTTIKNTVPAFTPTERQTLISTNYQELLIKITGYISALITEWSGKLDSQLTALGTNSDTRSPQATQNSTETTNINATKTTISSWQALTDTGVNGKYVSSNLTTISNLITSRSATITSRIAQIIAALGSVSQTGATYSGSGPYFDRQKWLNIRINRVSGSARRYYENDLGASFLGTMTTDNNTVKGEYDAYFKTKALVTIDGSNIVQVPDLADFNVGDHWTVVSETQPEILVAIMAKMGTNQLKLDKSVPATYTIADQARIFKTL